MTSPLESNFLVPNGTFLVALFLFLGLVLISLLVGGLVWFVLSHRVAADDR